MATEGPSNHSRQVIAVQGERCSPRAANGVQWQGMAKARRRAPSQPIWLATTAPGRSHIWAVGLAGFCSFLDVYVTQPILPHLANIFFASPAAAGLTISAVTLAMAISAPLIGVLADRIGRKRLIVAALLLLAAPTWLAAGAPNLAALVHWRFAQGLLVPGAFVVTIAYVTEEWSDRHTAAFAMGIYVAGTVLGGVSGRVIAAMVTDVAGWRTAFSVLAGLTLLCALAVWRMLPPAQRFLRQDDLGAAARAAAGHAVNPRLLATFAIGFNLLFMLVAMFSYVSFHLAAAPFRLGPTALGLVYLAYLPSLAVIPSAGAWTGRTGHRRALRLALLAVGAGAALTLLPDLPAVMAGLAISSGGLFIAQTAATSYLGVEAVTARSSAAGLYASVYYVGGSLGGVLPGLLWRRFHWTGCVVLVLLADAIAITLGSRWWRELPATATRSSGVGWILGRG